MKFGSPLIPAMLVRRYKRFLADVIFDTGEMTTVHVPNPGAMTGLDKPYSRVWLSDSQNPMRSLRYTWELIETDCGSGPEIVGVNTVQPNQLVAEALQAKADDIGADLLVAGAFGHARLWEKLLGGVTRDLLNRMALPVFMSH